MPGLHIVSCSSGQSGLATEDPNGRHESVFRGHFWPSIQECLQVYATNLLVRKGCKILCVENLGDLVKKWREDSGLSQPEFARRIGHGVKYQNIQQLETGKAKQPRYLPHLARAMGTTIDDLMALNMPPPLGDGSAREPVASYSVAKGNKKLRVATMARTLAGGVLEEMEVAEGADLGYVEIHDDTEGLFAIRVRGDALSPAVEDGEFVIVDLRSTCVPGDRVLLQLNDGKVLAKRLLFERGDAISVADLATKTQTTIERALVARMSPITSIYSANRWRPSDAEDAQIDSEDRPPASGDFLGGTSKLGGLDELEQKRATK